MSLIRGVPHPFPYQGSKRQLASQILACIPAGTERLIEPFAGSAAITIATAHRRLARRFVLNDIHQPLIELWKAIVYKPDELAADYRRLWLEQRGRERKFYDEVREDFNKRRQPHHFLYLLARCVKAAVRYNGKGEFNNSPDNRRKGMHPDTMKRNIVHTAELLRKAVRIDCGDYRLVLADATRFDFVYMDPPYQGVCETHNHRYCQGVAFAEFVQALTELNEKRVPYVVSYDGRTGTKTHGQSLPESLRLTRIEVCAGRSTQATLLGHDYETFESLYLSCGLIKRLGGVPEALRETDGFNLFTLAR